LFRGKTDLVIPSGVDLTFATQLAASSKANVKS
jgi:hypothetical protein